MVVSGGVVGLEERADMQTEAEAAGWLYGIARRQLALYFRRSAVEKRALQRLGLQGDHTIAVFGQGPVGK